MNGVLPFIIAGLIILRCKELICDLLCYVSPVSQNKQKKPRRAKN